MTASTPTPPSTSPDEQAALKKRLEWLRGAVGTSLALVAQKREKFQKYATRIYVNKVVLSGLVTICLGIDLLEIEPWLRRVALLLGVIVTILNALEPFFSFRALWVAHEEAKYRLHRLKDAIDCYIAGLPHVPINPATTAEFEANYQQIWERVSSEWLAHRRNSEGARDSQRDTTKG